MSSTLSTGRLAKPSTKVGLRTRSVRASRSSIRANAVPLPDLPYDYGALEPYISGDIMQLHHQMQ